MDTRAPLPFEIRPLSAQLGAEVLGVQLAHGIGNVLFDGIHAAFLRRVVR